MDTNNEEDDNIEFAAHWDTRLWFITPTAFITPVDDEDEENGWFTVAWLCFGLSIIWGPYD